MSTIKYDKETNVIPTVKIYLAGNIDGTVICTKFMEHSLSFVITGKIG